MQVVLLSGGSGNRLWPLSNETRSKQFLKILNTRSGDRVSMVQRVWGQLGEMNLQQSSVIATGKSQVELLQNQLGYEAEIIVEPERRDTLPAIALSACYLYSVKGVSLRDIIVVLPVDPYVENHFFEKVKELEQLMQGTDADLGLIGVSPDHPSSKFGYIVPEAASELEDGTGYFKVSHFVEKPDEELARQLMSQSALWNCGVFAFRLGYVIQYLEDRSLPIQYDELLKQYGQIEKTSFDYAVVEQANKIVALPYQGMWKDLGTWDVLTEEIQVPLVGKGTLTTDCVNTHVINELDIPITVIGVPNLIVAASPDGILVSDKHASKRIKEVLQFGDQRPMYEERRWGRYRVLDYTKYPNGNEVLTKRICVLEGKNLSYQYHLLRSEVWTVVSGHGEMILDGDVRIIGKGDVVLITAEAKHSLRAITDIEIIEVQTGSQLIEDDIVRLAMDWEEIKEIVMS
ncbi:MULTISPECIES: sugar phosphate nucleotidyltransferase [Paenibacillus]|uniref:Cupin domain-containing protein n=1 Tax=Paenibacillus campinasensis TaxID=66347 RepID=A0A268EZ60_9BACL|nr:MULTISPECIES: sugar phosphate nucleotidyltransferase [Paenibacillus]MUG65141.1 cupin domain-containing protein [Paenibacillus campinasensis]PAD78408.1 mannose-1-phosphate guanylyltransferase [Paenibacillus campinasensis]PAK52304.1 mannose-1-phosphate guanylyltransferase [Paenibacillus sp. 7541]